MTSITTQTLASAVAQVAPNQQPQPQTRQVTQVPLPNQVVQASKIAAEQQTTSLNRSDESRSAQVPKRTEGAFSNKRNKRKPGRLAKEEEKEEAPPQMKFGTDIVA